MSIKEKIVKDLSYEETRFQQLHTAHQSTLLVYARADGREKDAGHMKELARKLRPEFGKMFVCTQVRECFKIVRKHDADESLPSIDMILLDTDAHALKFLEAINKRPKSKETSQLPMMSTIMIIPEESSSAMGSSAAALGKNETPGLQARIALVNASIEAHGGASAVLLHSASSKEVLQAALEVLARRKNVENAYRDLKAAKMKATKHPYLPLFSSKNQLSREDGNDDDDDDFNFNESSASTQHHQLAAASPVGGSTASIAEMDDWTDTSSMLPRFIPENRERMSTKNLFAHTQGLSPVRGDTKTSTSMDIKARQLADKNIVKFIQSGRRLQDLAAETQDLLQEADHASRIDDIDDDNRSVVSQMTGIAPGDNDGGTYTDGLGSSAENALTGIDGTAEGDTHTRDESFASHGGSRVGGTSMHSLPESPPGSPNSRARKDPFNSNTFSPETGTRSRGQNVKIGMRTVPKGIASYLDPKLRPVWYGVGKSEDIMHNTTGGGGRPGDGGSVGGIALDTRSHKSTSSASEIVEKAVDLHTFIKKDIPQTAIVHSVGGLNKTVAAEQWKVINQSHYEDPGGEASSLASSLGEGVTSLQNNKIVSYLEKMDKAGELKRLAVGSDGVGLLGAEDTAAKRRTGVDPALVDIAAKTLKRMARDSAPDVQLNELLPIVLASGKVSLSDKDILEVGLKAEREGNNEVAITMYKRAGLHTTKPHLSKMFLAYIHYQMGKYMQALDYLTWAVESQDRVKHLSTHSSEEHFIAHYNRALVYFRLGNDEKGVSDMKKAISIDGNHLKAKEVLGLALRRVTKYGESIEISKQNVQRRKELELMELETAAALKHKEEMRAAAKKERKERSHRATGRGGVMIGEVRILGQGSIESVPSSRRDRISRAGSAHGSLHHQSSSMSIGTLDEDKPREVYCAIEDKGGNGSFRSRRLQRSQQISNQESSNSSMPGEALKTFKLTNGFHDNLYEGLFARPSSLQEAMMVPPGSRTVDQLETISCTLRLFPFLWRCSPSTITELSRCVEYRALQNRANLYHQNNKADGVCFLLRGTIQGKLEGLEISSGTGNNHKVVTDIAPNDTIGHIDMLFDNGNSPAPKDLFQQILNARRTKTAQFEAEFQSLAMPTAEGKESANSSIDDFNNRKSEDVDEKKDSDDESDFDVDSLPRCLQNKMFVTYSMVGLCELLICRKEDFDRLLYQDAYEELKKRVAIVEGCRVFSEWSHEEKIRLARMGHVQVYRSREVILRQGVKPNYVSLIMKGMCKSYKSPNKSTVLSGKLAECREKAARHDLKYSYHHKMRDTMSKGVLVPHAKASDAHKQSLLGRTHITVSEALRYSLGIEIKHLQKELQRAIEAELKQQEEEASTDEILESVTSKLSEISTLQWPQLFGEACMLDPENGTSRGTVVADTTLEVLNIHKSQLQTFRVRDNVLERMKYRCVVYPEDEELLQQKERKESWEIQRKALLQQDGKGAKEAYLEPFYV